MEIIEINEQNKQVILEIFNLSVDKENYILDENKTRIVCRYSKEPIKLENLAIMPGSEIKINNYSYCISEYINEFSNSE
ncbi:MAG: hypothetical protein Q7K34_04750 [archaeon]|nr:hypothetical protein [archaeon]